MSECTVDNSFGLKLYNWRMANNLTQKEAAFSLGCAPVMVWKWETGKANPRPSTKKRIMPIIESVPVPAQEPEEEPWVPGVTMPDNDDEDIDYVYTARPKTFRERMEQRYGSMEEYYRRMNERVAAREEVAEEQEDPVEPAAELPMPEEYPKLGCKPFVQEAVERAFANYTIKPAPSLVKLTKVIGFLECLALYAAEGVAEPLEEQIKVLREIAEEMGA